MLKKISRNPLFRNLHGEPLRNESLVLQKRTGYAQIYRYWLMLQSGIRLLDGTTAIGVRQIWEIYELWCFLKIKQLVCEVLDIDTDDIEQYYALVDERKSSIFHPFADGELEHQISFTNPDKIGEDKVELLYQHTYNRNSGEIHTVTTENRPDIVLNIKKPDGFMLTYLFDAKYRVFDDDKLNAEGVEEEMGILGAADYPPSDAINQMHRYRDAIYYGLKKEQQQQHTAKEIIGGYILFPGRGDDTAIRKRYFFKSIESVNIGAFPLLPDSQHPEQEAALLKEFLQRVILDQSTYEQLKDSIPQRGLRYDVEHGNEMILVGYANNAHRDMYLSKRMYYTHADMEKGSLRLKAGFETTKYLLMHNGNDRLELYRLSTAGPRIVSRQTILDIFDYEPSEGELFLLFDIESDQPIRTEGLILPIFKLGKYHPEFMRMSEIILQNNNH